MRLHVFGVKLCESCTRGLMPDYLGRRRIELITTVKVDSSTTPETVEYTVRAKLLTLAGSFSFAKRTLPRKLLELVTRPRRVGDPAFDDNVTAVGQPAHALHRALKNDGFQTAVLELALVASFTVAGGALEWTCVRRGQPDDQLVRDMRRNAAVVIHHLDKASGPSDWRD